MCSVFSVGADTTDISFAVRSPKRTARDRSATGRRPWRLPGDGTDGLGMRHPGPAAHAPFACEDRQQRNDAERQGDAQQHRGGESNAGRWDTVCQGVDHREQREAGTVRDPPQVPRTSIVRQLIATSASGHTSDVLRQSSDVRCWGLNRPKSDSTRRSPFDPEADIGSCVRVHYDKRKRSSWS